MAVTKATSDDVPIGARAVLFNFKTDKGACSVTYDRYNTNYATFSSLPQMTSNAIAAVLDTGRRIEDFTVYIVE